MYSARVLTSLALLVASLQAVNCFSWDIAVTAGDRIEFYTDDGTKVDTVRFNSQNLTALAYDEVHNMLLYVDKQSDNDAICGYSISYVEYKCYIQRNGRNIQGLAFDPVTEILFFTDTKKRSINWFSFKPGSNNNVDGNLLIKMDEGIPTDIAVDSCKGYVYWINTNLSTSNIERARFNGSDREVVINSTYGFDLHSLAIDQQTKKMYWFMPSTSSSWHVYSADLNGINSESLKSFSHETLAVRLVTHPNTLTVSKNFLFSMVDWCSPCVERYVWKFPKLQFYNSNKLFQVDTESVVGIAANYKMKDQFQGITDCNNAPNNYETDDSYKMAKEYEGPFCVHGIKVSGRPFCKCTSGYTGVRCEVSVCENYCLQGNCSFTEEGLPKCRCNADYSGERCEVNICNGYCFNNGTCSLNEEDEPVCECVGEYEGGKCEVPVRLDTNDGSPNEVEPACQCVGSHDGSRFKDVQNKTVSTTSTYNSAERNLTLVDLLANWQKPVATISVLVQVKTGN